MPRTGRDGVDRPETEREVPPGRRRCGLGAAAFALALLLVLPCPVRAQAAAIVVAAGR